MKLIQVDELKSTIRGGWLTIEFRRKIK